MARKSFDNRPITEGDLFSLAISLAWLEIEDSAVMISDICCIVSPRDDVARLS